MKPVIVSKAEATARILRVHTKINDELDDLKTSDPFLPPDTHAARALEVVPVHDNVDEQVQANDNP